MEDKLRVAIFKFTGCAGCQLEILHLEDELLDLAGSVDISYWMMVKNENSRGPWDISFVEGSVSTPREIVEIKEIRAKTEILVALGDCAIAGCIPSIRNYISQAEVEGAVYEQPSWIHSTRIRGIEEYVPVDIHLPGCPPHRETFLTVIKAALLGVKPDLKRYSVCMQCKLNNNMCLITRNGEPCLGPVTNAGCGAICPAVDRVCEGCYGPMSTPNTTGMVEILRELGITEEDIVRRFRKYAGCTTEFRREAEMID